MNENPYDAPFRLRRVIVLISERQGSQLRSTLDQFIRHVSPGMIHSHADFPVTVRRHPANVERCQSWLSRDQMLFFHVGNAVLGYYDTLRKGGDAGLFENQVKLLEQIAGLGLDEFVVVGTDSIGYTLRDKIAEREALLARQKAEEEEHRALPNAQKTKAR